MAGNYVRVSSKWCSKHRPVPATWRDRIRKWRGLSYHAKSGIHCDCPSITIPAPTGTYSNVEWCVAGEQLDALRAAPVGARIQNGPEDAPIWFVKSGPDEWRPCRSDGVPYSLRPWDERYDEPLWVGPFESAALHAFGLRGDGI